MNSIRAEYRSPQEWYSALLCGAAWQTRLEDLEKSKAADVDDLLAEAWDLLGTGMAKQFWGIHKHNILLAIEEVWEASELSLPLLKIQVIGMLMLEWLEKHYGACLSALKKPALAAKKEERAAQKQTVQAAAVRDEQQQDVAEKLKPIFFGEVDDARDFLVSIQGMKSTQITAKVNQLVRENKISELSKRRDLWKVLHDCGIYEKSESNWNQQVK